MTKTSRNINSKTKKYEDFWHFEREKKLIDLLYWNSISSIKKWKMSNVFVFAENNFWRSSISLILKLVYCGILQKIFNRYKTIWNFSKNWKTIKRLFETNLICKKFKFIVSSNSWTKKNWIAAPLTAFYSNGPRYIFIQFEYYYKTFFIAFELTMKKNWIKGKRK